MLKGKNSLPLFPKPKTDPEDATMVNLATSRFDIWRDNMSRGKQSYHKNLSRTANAVNEQIQAIEEEMRESRKALGHSKEQINAEMNLWAADLVLWPRSQSEELI